MLLESDALRSFDGVSTRGNLHHLATDLHLPSGPERLPNPPLHQAQTHQLCLAAFPPFLIQVSVLMQTNDEVTVHKACSNQSLWLDLIYLVYIF